jgi:O-antigen ligase
MTEGMRKEAGVSWLSVIWSARHDRAARTLNVDPLAVLIAILLPWFVEITDRSAGIAFWFTNRRNIPDDASFPLPHEGGGSGSAIRMCHEFYPCSGTETRWH